MVMFMLYYKVSVWFFFNCTDKFYMYLCFSKLDILEHQNEWERQ